MDSEAAPIEQPLGSPASGTFEDRRNIQVDNAIRAITDKQPVPEIDFTIHTMEDGKSVSTTERVSKDVQAPATYKPTDEQFFHDETHTKPDICAHHRVR